MEPLPIRAKSEQGMAEAMMFRLGYLIGSHESVWPKWAERFDLQVKLVRLDYQVIFTAFSRASGESVVKSTWINALRIKVIEDVDPVVWALYNAAKYAITGDNSDTQADYPKGGVT